MSSKFSTLADFGWTTFFSSQLNVSELDNQIPAKVAEVQRGNIRVVGPSLDQFIPSFYAAKGDDEARAIVGDWLLIDDTTFQPKRLLTRKSLLKRLAPGKGRKVQLIAANIDTIFIVSSCNQDFSIARMERYLALAHDAGVHPVIVLTKTDLTDTPQDFQKDALALAPNLDVVSLNAKSSNAVEQLLPWCTKGQTAAFLGSSGVGKSTLINSLIGGKKIVTQGVREGDDKGRHTTTSREMHFLDSGGLLLDMPGMRELQLTDVQTGVEEVFADITELALTCRFRDCKHETEPGCAISAALKAGELEENRLQRWKKLRGEDAINTANLAKRHAREKHTGKTTKRGKPEIHDE